MGSQKTELSGPDLAAGVAFADLPEGAPFLGHAGGEGVVLVRSGEKCFAVGATCTHYSGPLAEGIVREGSIRCPWHHARFELETGAPVGGPGLGSIPCFDVVREGALVRVGKKREPAVPAEAKGPASVVAIGSGASAMVLAETLRSIGYRGSITLIGDEGIPVDRPNLSKDYLAGTAPEEWLPLRDAAALAEKRIELVAARATRIDLAGARVEVEGRDPVPYGALVIATGAAPNVLSIPGAASPHVFTLRTLADSRAIVGAAGGAKRAVVIGGGFIGLEAAASLRARGLEVTVVLRESVPLAHVLGERLGAWVEAFHVEHGVKFVRGVPARIDGAVVLEGGERLEADLVVVGIGVRPRVELAEAAGLRLDRGVVVDDRLRTSAPGVFAIGDVARFPWDGELVRVEHWVHAERMGTVAARNVLGKDEAFRMTPFFWSQHFDVPIAYVGAGAWDAVLVIGDPAARDVMAIYRRKGKVVAMASIYRDRESLELEDLLERGDEAGVEALALRLGPSGR